MSPLWRNRLIALGGGIALLAASFSAGRFSAPLRVESRQVDRVVYQDKIVERVVTITVAAKTVYVDRVIERAVTKDGAVTERIVEKISTKEDTKANADTASAATREGKTTNERLSTTTLRPSWRAGALVGASYQQPLLSITGPLVLGVVVEHRIVGGLWVGAWTLPQHGAVGASLSLEF